MLHQQKQYADIRNERRLIARKKSALESQPQSESYRQLPRELQRSKSEKAIREILNPPDTPPKRPQMSKMKKDHETFCVKSSKKASESMMKWNLQEEFIHTEKLFNESLSIMVNIYLEPLRKCKIISKASVDKIFSNIDNLYDLNQQLMEKLNQVDLSSCYHMRRPNKNITFVEALKRYIPFLKIYTVYINNFDESNEEVKKLMAKNKKFVKFCDEKKELPQSKSLDLTSLLITPVQRLCKIETLLGNLVDCKYEEQTEQEELQKLHTAVKEINVHVNNSKAQQDTRKKLYALQEKVKHKVDIFITPNRLICEAQVNFHYGSDHIQLASDRINGYYEQSLAISKYQNKIISVPRASRALLDKLPINFERIMDPIIWRKCYIFLFDNLGVVVKSYKNYQYVHHFHLGMHVILEDRSEETVVKMVDVDGVEIGFKFENKRDKNHWKKLLSDAMQYLNRRELLGQIGPRD